MACCSPAVPRTWSRIVTAARPAAPARCTIRERDATTLPLIPRAIAAGVPVLGVCRGFQEMNVAFGGTLWQHVHEVPGYHVHHEDTTAATRCAVRRPRTT